LAITFGNNIWLKWWNISCANNDPSRLRCSVIGDREVSFYEIFKRHIRDVLAVFLSGHVFQRQKRREKIWRIHCSRVNQNWSITTRRAGGEDGNKRNGMSRCRHRRQGFQLDFAADRASSVGPESIRLIRFPIFFHRLKAPPYFFAG